MRNAALVGILALTGTLAAESPRRNVVLLIADDLGMEVGCYGDKAAKTPNIDALGNTGTRFTHGFASVSSCSPSRAAILTGLPTHQSGQYGLAHAEHNFHTFRDVQSAAIARDPSALRDRVTPAMFVELAARGDRLRAGGRSIRVEAVDVTSEVTEAWHDDRRDYVPVYVAGSMRSHTVDDATGRTVEGAPTRPVPVEAFLTFTRPAGLNFWMLSLIQGE